MGEHSVAFGFSPIVLFAFNIFSSCELGDNLWFIHSTWMGLLFLPFHPLSLAYLWSLSWHCSSLKVLTVDGMNSVPLQHSFLFEIYCLYRAKLFQSGSLPFLRHHNRQWSQTLISTENVTSGVGGTPSRTDARSESAREEEQSFGQFQRPKFVQSGP